MAIKQFVSKQHEITYTYLKEMSPRLRKHIYDLVRITKHCRIIPIIEGKEATSKFYHKEYHLVLSQCKDEGDTFNQAWALIAAGANKFGVMIALELLYPMRHEGEKSLLHLLND